MFNITCCFISSRLSTSCGCLWAHVWSNHRNSLAFSINSLSPSFSSSLPCWKYFPEKPRLSWKPGTSFWRVRWVMIIACTAKHKFGGLVSRHSTQYCGLLLLYTGQWAISARVLSPFCTRRFFSRDQAKHKCDWVVMSSVFVASQSSCCFLCSREKLRQVENRRQGHFPLDYYAPASEHFHKKINFHIHSRLEKFALPFYRLNVSKYVIYVSGNGIFRLFFISTESCRNVAYVFVSWAVKSMDLITSTQKKMFHYVKLRNVTSSL